MIRVKTQLSVVIENRPGVLTRICDTLASHQINIEGFSAYGEREHGIVRLVTSNPDRAADVLANGGFLVTRTDVLSVKLPNRPAGLARLARKLATHRVNIDYAYGSAAAAGRVTTVFLRVANPKRACQILAGPAPSRPARQAAATASAASGGGTLARDAARTPAAKGETPPPGKGRKKPGAKKPAKPRAKRTSRERLPVRGSRGRR